MEVKLTTFMYELKYKFDIAVPTILEYKTPKANHVSSKYMFSWCQTTSYEWSMLILQIRD